MSSIDQSHKWALALALAVLPAMVAPARAESPWRAVARLIAPASEQPAVPAVALEPQAEPAAEGLAATADPELGVTRGFGEQESATSKMLLAIDALGERMPSLRPGDPRLGLESQETQSSLATNLFQNPEIRKLLGDQPRFIYDAADKNDPMVVPWVRRAAIYRELSTQAEDHLKDGQIDEALDLFGRIIALNDQRFTPLVRQRLSQIQAQQQAEVEKMLALQSESSPAREVVELPQWVQTNTSGVLREHDGSGLCLVGEYMLRVGQPLPNYPEITVAEIGERAVVYRIRDLEFKVVLNDLK